MFFLSLSATLLGDDIEGEVAVIQPTHLFYTVCSSY